MTDREHTLSIKLSADELAKAHALADAGDESIARAVRRFIVEGYAARFGDVVPPRPKLKPGPHAKK